jgi:hypothetical protein
MTAKIINILSRNALREICERHLSNSTNRTPISWCDKRLSALRYTVAEGFETGAIGNDVLAEAAEDDGERVAAATRIICDQNDALAVAFKALQASEAEYQNLDERAPLDAGCIRCTVGTVPNHRNTGLCAHHLRQIAIARIEGRAS